MSMRIAPRTMLISTGFYVGIDADADEQYGEFREWSLQAGDLRSSAIASAGRILSFAHNGIRVPEVVALASEVEDVPEDMDSDAVGCIGEALASLLIDRGTVDDLAEAHHVVDEWRARRPGIPLTDLWWLKSLALLAKADGDSDAHAELATQYLELCEKLDARGRLAEARQMARTGG
jgi:hypothetical protein